MKKFSFPLEKVMDYKGQVLEALQQEHAAIIQEMNQQNGKIAELQAEIDSARREFQEKRLQGVSVLVIQTYESYLNSLYKKMEKEQEILQIIQRKEELKRQQVLNSKTEVTSLEHLKDQRYRQYMQAVQKNEEQFIEEFVSHTRVSRV